MSNINLYTILPQIPVDNDEIPPPIPLVRCNRSPVPARACDHCGAMITTVHMVTISRDRHGAYDMRVSRVREQNEVIAYTSPSQAMFLVCRPCTLLLEIQFRHASRLNE